MITYILHPSCFCDIWALCVSRITYMKFKNNIQDTFFFWFWHGVKKLRKLFFIKIAGSSPANILEKHSITGFFLLLLRTFSEHLFYGSPPGFSSNQYRNRNRVECSIKNFLWKVVKNPNENINIKKKVWHRRLPEKLLNFSKRFFPRTHSGCWFCVHVTYGKAVF